MSNLSLPVCGEPEGRDIKRKSCVLFPARFTGGKQHTPVLSFYEFFLRSGGPVVHMLRNTFL